MSDITYAALCTRKAEGKRIMDMLRSKITGTLCLLLADRLGIRTSPEKVTATNIEFDVANGKVTVNRR